MVSQPRVAVIGSGVSGLTAAYLLSGRNTVVLFEAEDRLGGHAHTHHLSAEDGRDVAVDSGFVVHNPRNYPRLCRLFDQLGVTTRDTEMSLSVSCRECGLEYAGARKLRGLFPGGANLNNVRYLRLLTQVRRFHRQASRLLDHPRNGEDTTFGQFLESGGYTEYFVRHFALPLVSAVWSVDPALGAHYPARYLFEFLRNHGMLSVGGSPEWRTVVGGSHEYVRRIAERLSVINRRTPVRAVEPHADGVDIRDHTGRTHSVDRVVVATHADQALRLLAAPTERQRRVLGAFRYSENEAVLHTDTSPLPRRSGARASWNYLKETCAEQTMGARISYDMNRLMRLAEPENYVVTLNAADQIHPDRVVRRMRYRHPVYTPESVAAQRQLPELGDARLRFAGAYHGWGFHEDGCLSGMRAAMALGVGGESRVPL
ncbi:amine oxidase [Actinopolyspora mortivallis]|uniref:Amine oxidase n=1 Tax=Actinopolyspora mortivallis TaxID=33906 RepID=A0A2T0GWM6_ACTMO|nr:amine oxidase [Actinopolyspora mortivallis]